MPQNTGSTPTADFEGACFRFVRWLDARVVAAARGDGVDSMEVQPVGKLWLGRLAPMSAATIQPTERGERLDPCAIGMRLRPASAPPFEFTVKIRCRAWQKGADGTWRKSSLVAEDVPVRIAAPGSTDHARPRLAAALATVCGAPGLEAAIRTEYGPGADAVNELTIFLVNLSPEKHPRFDDTNLYECAFDVLGLDTRPFLLEGLPDSFRYDRRVPAYGLNCGVAVSERGFTTTDTVVVDRSRPRYWSVARPQPDLSFATLAENPLPPLSELVEALSEWGASAWSEQTLSRRAREEQWSPEMEVEARRAAAEFAQESTRVRGGLELLASNEGLRRAFQGMNRAIERSASGKYAGWRPFQIGFLLANLTSITSIETEASVADIVWFATGGGKTETYLGMVITAALFDRMRGKISGITAWSRFPLRMLSLQQTQRFADALAAAELVRREMRLPGDPFSLGFFVGMGATPNSIPIEPRDGDFDPDDPAAVARARVLLRCPFCRSESLEMRFNRRVWQLEHHCTAASCPWGTSGLPFYIVDDEIYRHLPTVIVGTLDKAASIARQASMRGLVGAPSGRCSREGHGYTYAARSKRPTGCLVPECPGEKTQLGMREELFPPTLRLQDELHLLKDSLGAVDSHYEALFDHLQQELTGQRPKVLASSATLTGFEKQTEVLYQRRGRVFPCQGPSDTDGFWTSDSRVPARRFVALAPRGVTVEYAVDRTMTELQTCARLLRDRPEEVCRSIGIDPSYGSRLLDLYGVDVVYGNTLRDIEAAGRSFETQIAVSGKLQTVSLTGRTPFDEVRTILDRLEKPEPAFDERIHAVTASAMMSHGVDVDRLNVMMIMGLPLSTAEFIQATARVGRRYPGLVFVFPKMARERDASVFRSFEHFVLQGDRFVEPIPITRRSRRVLEQTLPGLFMARLRQIHEPASGMSLATTDKVREYFRTNRITVEAEFQAIAGALGLSTALDEPLRQDLRDWIERFFENLYRVSDAPRFPDDLSPTTPPMLSLRDVEQQAPVIGLEPRS